MEAPHRPHRLQGALFQSIGDEGRATLVERRITEMIMGGHLQAGERLPTETDLARTFGVSPVTMREALLVLRTRGMIVTKRGRNGGSFVTEDADPLEYTRATLLASTRVALRDLGAHYVAITAAAVALAVRRADPTETAAIATRLSRLDDRDLERWRRTLDDVLVEIVALSQSARLTREQMSLQAEFSPYLRLVDLEPEARAAQRDQLTAVIDAIDAGDGAAATAAIEAMTAVAIERLISIQGSSEQQTSV